MSGEKRLKNDTHYSNNPNREINTLCLTIDIGDVVVHAVDEQIDSIFSPPSRSLLVVSRATIDASL